MRQDLETEQKALEINLDDSIYGTLAEIGAGQEVARNFFKVGAAAGTIAKTMSAYDKVVSDEIYGPEAHGRYVCESRLDKMLDHEWELIEQRLRKVRPETNFFVFANTVATSGIRSAAADSRSRRSYFSSSSPRCSRGGRKLILHWTERSTHKRANWRIWPVCRSSIPKFTRWRSRRFVD